jgi:Fe-coproporphyrin III synthase
MSNHAMRLPARARAYGHVIQSRLRSMAHLKRPPLPHAAHILITWGCNLRCDGCDAWQRKPEGELDATQWAQVFRELPFLDIIKIIGGEPFTRTDLPEIIRSIRKEIDPFVVQLVTNGALTDRILEFVDEFAWPGLHVRVSLDGLRETHDRSRGQEGSFDSAMLTLNGLAEIRKRKKFNVGVNFTMTDESVQEMEVLSEMCRAIDIDVVPGFKVKPFLRDCDIRKERAEVIGMQDRSEAIRELNRTRHGASSGFNSTERFFLRALNRVVFRKHAAGGDSVKFHCGELRNLMYLNPGGGLITCGLNQKPFGSVIEKGFKAIWNSQKMEEGRQIVRECPGCMQGAVEIMSRLYE